MSVKITPQVSILISVILALLITCLVVFRGQLKDTDPYGVSQSVEYVDDSSINGFSSLIAQRRNKKFVLNTFYYVYVKSKVFKVYKVDYCSSKKEVESLKCIRYNEAMVLAKEMYELNKSVCE
jgi:hypothetical protein